MSLTFRLNPPVSAAAYLACLNRCFESWGDEAQYRWCYVRQVGSLHPDLLVLEADGRMVAGAGLVYRPVALPNGRVVEAGIISGAWTLPEYRGRGGFTRLIDESRARSAERGAALLLAFTRETNASSRRVAAAGATMIPTHYVFGSPATGADSVAVVPASPAELWRRTSSAAGEPPARFSYSHAEWEAQFVGRRWPTRVLDVGGILAAVEYADGVDHVLALSSGPEESRVAALVALADTARRGGRKLRTFIVGPLGSASAAAGFEVRPGHLSVWIADCAAFDAAWPHRDLASLDRWLIHSGDRM